MTRDEMDALLRTILVQDLRIKVDPDTITPGTTLEQLDIDSLEVVEIAQIFEDTTGVKVRGEDAEGVQTIGDVLDVLTRLSREQLVPTG